MTSFWKKVEFWSIDNAPMRGDSGSKIFAIVLLNSWFHLIWYATWPYSEKVQFWPYDVAAFAIPFNLICNMQQDYVLKKLKFNLLTLAPGSGGKMGFYQ